MDLKVTDPAPCRKQVTVTVPAEQVDGSLDRSYATLRGQVALPGFRAGRVPRKILERRFGDHVIHEVTQDLVEELIREAIQELDLEIISKPELTGEDEEESGEAKKGHGHAHVSPGEPFTFSFVVDVKPSFDLPEYKGVEVARKVREIEDEDVDKVLGNAAEAKATFQPADDGDEVRADDLVAGDLKVMLGERVLVESEEVRFTVDQPLADSYYLEDAPDVLPGKKVGDEVALACRIGPRHADEEARGQEGEGFLTITELKHLVVPAADDELAKEHGEESLEAWRARIRKELEQAASTTADRDVVKDVLKKLTDEAGIELASGSVDRMQAGRLMEQARQLRMHGVPDDKAREIVAGNADQVRSEIEQDSRSWFLVEKIAEKEKIFATEEDLDRRFAEIAAEAGSTPSKVRAYLEQADLLDQLRSSILEEKVCAFLKDHAKIVEESPGDTTEEGETADEGGSD